MKEFFEELLVYSVNFISAVLFYIFYNIALINFSLKFYSQNMYMLDLWLNLLNHQSHYFRVQYRFI